MDLTEEISIHFWYETFSEDLKIFEAIKLYQSSLFFRELILDLIRRNKVRTEALYCFGDNRKGQLGLGNRTNQLIPVRNNFFKYFSPIKQIALGEKHSLVLLENNDLYVFGENEMYPENVIPVHDEMDRYGEGQLGLGRTLDQLVPVQNYFFEQLSPIKRIFADGGSSMVLMDNGDLYVFGSNGYGQLGIGPGKPYQEGIPIRNHFFDQLSSIKQIALGRVHTLVVLENNDLYVFGWDYAGQLGLGSSGDMEIQYTPVKHPFFDRLSPIKNIFARGDSSMVLLENGELYVFGANPGGQLGLGHNIYDIVIPVKNDFFDYLSPIERIIMGDKYAIVLLKNEDLYIFGFNISGELGLGNTDNQFDPVQNHFFDQLIPIKQISLGEAHSMILPEDGNLYVFGNNGSGQLGLGHTENELLPVQNNFFDQFDSIEEIILGAGHSMVLVDEPI